MNTVNCLKLLQRSLLSVGFLTLTANAAAQQCNDMDFTDVTLSAGIDHVYVWPPTRNNLTVGGATAADVNGDGWLDIYAVQGDGSGNFLYINDKNGGFTEEAAARNAQLNGFNGTGASAADFDNDGDIDLMATVYYDEPKLLVNDGTGNFTVTSLPFPNQRVFSSSWGDVDNDGYLELAIAQWMSRSETGPQGLRVYKNNAGTLTEYEFRTQSYSDEHVFAPRFADLNGDRLQDIHSIHDYGASRLYMNVGGGMFEGSTGFGGDNDMGHAIGDYDKDGDLDIFTTDIEPTDDADKSGNTLWKNNGQASFTNVSEEAGIIMGGWAWAGSFGDLDLDADLDIYHVNGFTGDGEIWKDDPHLLFMNNDDGTFTEVAECAGAGVAEGSQGRGMHLFDYDNDGDLDIFIVNNRYMITGEAGEVAPPVLLRNDTPRNGRHWLKVTLDGTPPMHRDGIGSRVYVTTGSTTQLHELHASTNYLSQDAGHIAHFGLNTATTADEVRAEWVTGDATVVSDIAGDQQISIPSPTATVSNRTPSIGQQVTATSNESNPVEWEVGGNTFTDPVTTSFSSGGTHELTLNVYNVSMTEIVRQELIRVDVDGGSGEPDLTSPVPGTTLELGDVTFNWSDNGADVDDWQFLVGTSVGDNSLFDSGVVPSTTTASLVSGLPEDGSTLHATLRWTDGGDSTDKNYTYTAATNPITNEAPTVVAATGNQDFDQGDSVNLDMSLAFDDADGDVLSFAASGLPASLSIDPDSGIVSGALTNDDALAGPDYAVSITATEVGTDELYSVDDDFTLTVNNVNDAPTVIAPIGDQDFDEGDSVNLDTSSAFEDIDGEALTYSATGLPANLSIDPDSGIVGGTLTNDDFIDGPDYAVTITATEPPPGGASIAGEGLSVDDSFTLTVNNINDAPTVVAPIGNQMINVGTAVNIDAAAAFEDVDGDALTYFATGLPAGLTIDPNTVFITGVLTIADFQGGPDYAISVTATEAATTDGFSVDDNFTLTVLYVDTTAPVINLIGPAMINVTVGDSYNDQGATAVDELDGDLTASIIVNNPVNTSVEGNYTVTYNVSDAAGNAAIEVSRSVVVTSLPDVTAPVISLTGSASVTITVGDTYVDAGATATDDFDGDLTASILVDNPVDTNVVGTYTVRYNVTDAAGNAAMEVSRTVIVAAAVDTTPPVITLLGDAEVTITEGDDYEDAGATATDDADGDLTDVIVTVNNVDSDTVGTYTVTYNVMDSALNPAIEVTRTVIVEEADDPPPPPPTPPTTTPSSGGGGSTSLLALIALAGLIFWSRDFVRKSKTIPIAARRSGQRVFRTLRAQTGKPRPCRSYPARYRRRSF